MSHVLSEEMLLAALASWQLSSPMSIKKIPDGYGGVVWSVTTPEQRYIAKLAYEMQAVFEFGLRIAELVEQSGIPAGRPVRTPAGQLSVMIEAPLHHLHPLALLHFIPGEPLDWSKPEAPSLVGHTLAHLHRIPFNEQPIAAMEDSLLAYVSEQTEEVLAQPGLSTLIMQAVDAVRHFESTLPVTYGLTYGDGMDFLYDQRTGNLGLIDWGTAEWGRCLYDIGLAIGQFRGSGASEQSIEQFLTAYCQLSPLSAAELAGVRHYIALRWALLAKFFSWRLAHNINANGDPYDNACSLREVRAALEQAVSNEPL